MNLKKALSLVCGVLLSSAVAAHANPFTFTGTGTGTLLGEDATASILVVAGTGLQVTLGSTNNTPGSDALMVSGILITLSNSGTCASTCISGTSGIQLIDIASNGSVTNIAGSEDHWGASTTGTTVCLETVSTFGCAQGGQPHDLIIGPGPYTGTNSSITQHQPSIQGSGTFDLSIAGLTAGTTVTGVTFEFGTGKDSSDDVTGVPTQPGVTPEPSSLVMLGTGLLGAAGMFRRRAIAALRG